MNFRDITNTSFVTCYYGNYGNPYLNTGIISNRHSIITNTYLRDPNSNDQLSMVPPGESYSIKLGNDYSNYQAEAIKYTFRVDTNNFDILIMKYAVVLENPDHNWYNQPRFKMEILDSNNVLIDSCGYADFYASNSLGWNYFNFVVWKNWTTIGIDLSNYHNRIINLRFTTYDCNMGAHFGYAYYNLSCGRKNIRQMTCGDANDLIFEAPLGFNYQWYSAINSDVFSTSRTITIPSDNQLYFCRCSSLEDDDCNFTLSVLAQRQYPYANFQFVVDNCQKKIHLIDNSIISSSNDSAVGNIPCDSIIWILPGNSPYYNINPTIFFDTAGTYPISIIAFIGDGLCVDTFQADIIIPDYVINNITFSPFDNNICQGDSLSISINDVFDKYYWSNGDTTNSIIVSPNDTSEIFIRAIDSYGCEKNDSVTIYVNPILTTNINDSICQGQTYNLYGFNEDSAGIHKKTLINIYGCDSIIYLNLKVKPVFRDTIYAEICRGETFNQYGFDEDSIGIYSHQFQSILGCDSIVYLNLMVKIAYKDTINAQICFGNTYNEYDFNEDSTGVFTKNLVSVLGCDSIVTLNLKVNPEFIDTIYAEICQGETYNLYGFNEDSAGVFTKNLVNVYGCDSIVNLILKVKPVFRDTIYAEICKGETFNQYGFEEDSSGIYTHLFQSILGCDSIVYLNLNVNPSYNDTIYAEICKGEIYNMNGFNESDEGLYYQYLQAQEGCDSSITLNLYVQEMGLLHSLFEKSELVVDDLPITLNASCDYCNNYYWNSGYKDSLYTVYQYGL